MSVRILVGREQGDSDDSAACLFDSVTGWAFGPVFAEAEDGTLAEDMAEEFILYAQSKQGDPRSIPEHELEKLYMRWLGAREQEAEVA